MPIKGRLEAMVEELGEDLTLDHSDPGPARQASQFWDFAGGPFHNPNL
jgi:hypothetical protein